MEMPVDLVVLYFSDEGTIFRENLVSRHVTCELVEPVATGEGFLPYFRTTESLEVLNPHIPINLLDMFQGRYSLVIRSG